jgi:two-component system response regulator VicR
MFLQEGDQSRKVNILIVEDDSDLQKILKLNLAHEGFEVSQAFNGVECFEVIRQTRPDLILLDLMMPEMDGFEVCKRLKSMSSTFDIPVIVLTVQEELKTKLRCFAFKADDYVVKPYEFEDLLARIYLHINKVVENQERSKSERSRTQRTTMKKLSEQVAEAYKYVEAEIKELESKLPPDASVDLKRMKSVSRELVGVVERSREELDPAYSSVFLEEED